MKIGISWNETEQRFYVTVKIISASYDEMRPFRRKEEIEAYLRDAKKKFPDEPIDAQINVSDFEKPGIEEIVESLKKEKKND